jgi:hypothetical protein
MVALSRNTSRPFQKPSVMRKTYFRENHTSIELCLVMLSSARLGSVQSQLSATVQRVYCGKYHAPTFPDSSKSALHCAPLRCVCAYALVHGRAMDPSTAREGCCPKAQLSNFFLYSRCSAVRMLVVAHPGSPAGERARLCGQLLVLAHYCCQSVCPCRCRGPITAPNNALVAPFLSSQLCSLQCQTPSSCPSARFSF